MAQCSREAGADWEQLVKQAELGRSKRGSRMVGPSRLDRFPGSGRGRRVMGVGLPEGAVSIVSTAHLGSLHSEALRPAWAQGLHFPLSSPC